jgi:hypothetical protein
MTQHVKFGKENSLLGGDDGTYNLGYSDFFGIPQMVDFFGIKNNCCDRAICSLTRRCEIWHQTKKIGPTPYPRSPQPPSPLFPSFAHLFAFFQFFFCSRWFSILGGRVAHTRAHQ